MGKCEGGGARGGNVEKCVGVEGTVMGDVG